MRPANIRISASVRLIFAMFRIYAGVVENFGQVILDILKDQYPGQDIDMTAGQIGRKLMNTALNEVQHNDQDAMDAIQDFLTYITIKNWNFRKDFNTWRQALTAINRNIATKAISVSMKKYPKVTRQEMGEISVEEITENMTDEQKEAFENRIENMTEEERIKLLQDLKARPQRLKSIDRAFGKRPEGGGPAEGGEAFIPDISESRIPKRLDERAAVKEFMDIIDEYIPDLRRSLSSDARKLFDLIYDDEIGTFGSDIKENMGQASALKDKYPELYAKHSKRWSGFVGDLRKTLLNEIWKFIDNFMTPSDYMALKEMFFSETTPRDIKRLQEQRQLEKGYYQQGIDERKLADWKWLDQHGILPDSERRSYENLAKKLKKSGFDVDKIEPTKPKPEKFKRLNIKDPEAPESKTSEPEASMDIQQIDADW